MNMIRSVFLLLPVFISLFWSVTLMGSKKKFGKPRRFLSWFMLIPAFLFTAHFMYFAPYPDLYPYFEFPLTVGGMIVFPLYHFYFRLLTVDERISLQTLALHLAIPLINCLVFGITIILTPKAEFRDWLLNGVGIHSSQSVRVLQVIRICIKAYVLVQLIITIIGNSRLIRKYGDKAEQFYSDILDTNKWNSRMLNYSILLMSLASFAAIALGRTILMPKNKLIYFIWSVFSISLYMIGLLGLKQKTINPSFETVKEKPDPVQLAEPEEGPSAELLKRILAAMNNHKLYLNPELCIVDVAKVVGSNRTYVSNLINKSCHSNFCSFVNDFRIKELERVIAENPGYTAERLSEVCGFGSINSMNRAIHSKTGMSFRKFKSRVHGISS